MTNQKTQSKAAEPTIVDLVTRPFEPALYKSFLDALTAAGQDAPTVGLFPAGGAFEIRFPPSMEKVVDQAMTDLAAVESAALEEAKSKARSRIVAHADIISARIVSRYPQTETMGWPTKHAEAKSILNGGEVADTLLLKSLAVTQGLDRDAIVALASVIVEKAQSFADASSAIETMRASVQSEVQALTSVSDVEPTVSRLKAEAHERIRLAGFGAAIP